MGKFQTFPHYNINIKDESVRFPIIPEILPQHRPMFMSVAAKGPINVPIWGSYKELSDRFGKGMFDPFSKYHKHPSVYITEACKHQRAFFVRVAPDDAAVGGLVLEAHVQDRDIPQWEKDAGTGQRLTDANGDWVPLLDGTNNPIADPGVGITWKTRALLPTEDADNIAVSVVTDSAGDITVYPVAVFVASSPGEFANVEGFRIWWDNDSDMSVSTAMESLLFRIAVMTTPYGSDVPQFKRNKFLATSSEFTFKADTVDPSTKKRYFLGEILEGDYSDLPYIVYHYPTNVEAIGTRCIAVEDAVLFPEIVDSPFMVNTVTGMGPTGQFYYDHIVVGGPVIDVNATTPNVNMILDESATNFLVGGSDGDISDASLETLTTSYLSGNIFPDIVDSARYPVTHLYDSGYSSATKEAMIDFIGIKEDLKVIMSTQVVSSPANTKAEDVSLGSFLRSRILLHPESFIFGTPAIRGTIFMQAGKLAQYTGHVGLVPATFDCLRKKCVWQGAIFIKGKPKGLPRSGVTSLKDINWFPVAADFKQSSWDNALNYIQYYDMTRFHYSDVISVYPYLTSLLSDDIFVDMLVYLKHIVRMQWSIFAGMDNPIHELISEIRDSINHAVYEVMGDFMRIETNPYQTDLDKELGYSLTVEIAAYGTVPNRVWNVIIPVRRELV